MTPVIDRLNASEYKIPEFKAEEKELVFNETHQILTFIRPELEAITKEQELELQEMLKSIKSKKGKKTAEDKIKIKEIEGVLSHVGNKFEAVTGVSVGDILTCVIQELKDLGANEEAIKNIKQAKFWLNEKG